MVSARTLPPPRYPTRLTSPPPALPESCSHAFDIRTAQVNLLLLDQCQRKQWFHGMEGRCVHTDVIEEDIRTLAEHGVTSVRYRFWNYTKSRHAFPAPDDFDLGKIEADKTRLLLHEMIKWKPNAHFYIKARSCCALLCSALRCAIAAALLCWLERV